MGPLSCWGPARPDLSHTTSVRQNIQAESDSFIDLRFQQRSGRGAEEHETLDVHASFGFSLRAYSNNSVVLTTCFLSF
jgi:hypothetical protein